jgi:opacity protein-like surface antigen
VKAISKRYANSRDAVVPALFAKGKTLEMTRPAVATVVLTILISSLAFAQDATPKVQVFGGYSLVHAGNGSFSGATLDFDLREQNSPFGIASFFPGWNAEAQYNVTRWLGIVADASGRYGQPITGKGGDQLSGLPSLTGYTLLVGPAFSFKNKTKFTPFVHALFGYDRASLNSSTITGVSTPVTSVATTNTDAAVALGGGVDYKVSRRFALRLAQLDDLHTTHDFNKFYGSAFPTGIFEGLPTKENNFRISAGIIVKF